MRRAEQQECAKSRRERRFDHCFIRVRRAV
jgi:hypothetical protein